MIKTAASRQFRDLPVHSQLFPDITLPAFLFLGKGKNYPLK
jgi:hypothetical protein